MGQNQILVNVLRKEDLRYTQQRQAVWDEVKSTNRHRDADDIYVTLHQKGIAVSRATVYRTIDVLAKYNLINKIDIGDGKNRYEHVLDSDHHDHLICTRCGDILEFVDDEIEALQTKIAEKYDFILEDHVHQLMGICRTCNEKSVV